MTSKQTNTYTTSILHIFELLCWCDRWSESYCWQADRDGVVLKMDSQDGVILVSFGARRLQGKEFLQAQLYS